MARPRQLGYGEGSVYEEKKTGRWIGELRVGLGRRRVTGWTRQEAMEKLDKIRAESNAGVNVGDHTSLGEWLDWYMETVVATKDPNTHYSYQWAVSQLGPLRGCLLRDLSPFDVEELLKKLSTSKRPAPKTGGNKRTKRGGRSKPLSKSSLNRIKMVLGAALYEAERRQLVTQNVARLANLPANARKPTARRSLTVEEARSFLDVIRGKDDEALILVALTMGLRPGEVTGLPWKAVDLNAGTLEVRQALKRLPDGTLKITTPKTDSYRTLRLPAGLIESLRSHRQSQRKTRLATLAWEDHGLVFTNAIGRPIDSSNLRRMVKNYATLSEVGHLSPNELRHSATSLLVECGQPLQDVADMLGHRDIRMLAQTYRHKIRPVVDVTGGQGRMFGG
jgi:integrase